MGKPSQTLINVATLPADWCALFISVLITAMSVEGVRAVDESSTFSHFALARVIPQRPLVGEGVSVPLI